VQVSQKWMLPLGIVLACGAAGLLVGFALPLLGVLAAVGLVIYFICALAAHLRVRDPGSVGRSVSCRWRWPRSPSTSAITITCDASDD
jgi:hypothetical protein